MLLFPKKCAHRQGNPQWTDGVKEKKPTEELTEAAAPGSLSDSIWGPFQTL